MRIAAVFALIFFCSNVFAGLEQDIIGRWRVTSQTCSDGSEPTAINEDLQTVFDGQTLYSQKLNSGCIRKVTAPYSISSDHLEYTYDSMTLECNGGRPQHLKFDPVTDRILITKSNPILQMWKVVNWPNGPCPIEASFIVDFERMTNNPAGRDCFAPWGSVVQDGLIVVAYKYNRPPAGERCQSEIRRCNDGVLTGFYRYRNCSEN